ncbi:anti-sigma factor [Falsibacillus albus]|uniref:Anti-sigma-W factor RsiW n=1 Tax=Falsibacillus albus TaxID=2478915 RepID=A0A3L7JQM5_9BACI|nr:anti-sigma factor [Falsibacillus albus]RLQ93113.1 hypothetical protein D9X91_18965 [Falsibacillus albus]
MNYSQCENLIDYFNQSLSESEKRAFEEHLEQCADCREELKEWTELTSDLAFESEAVSPPEGMKERVLMRVFEEDEEVTPDTVNPNPQPEPIAPVTPMKEKHPAQKRAWLLPAMAAALLLSVGANFYLGSQVQQNGAVNKTAAVDQVVKYLALNPVDSNASGMASFVKQKDNVSMVIQASNLAKLKGDEVYQVWLIKDKKPIRAGAFKSSTTGDGAVVFRMDKKEDQDLSQYDTVAITLEPNADSQTPKGNMVLASKL